MGIGGVGPLDSKIEKLVQNPGFFDKISKFRPFFPVYRRFDTKKEALFQLKNRFWTHFDRS